MPILQSETLPVGALLHGGEHRGPDRLDAAAEPEAREEAAARGDDRQMHLGTVAGLQLAAQFAQAVDQPRARGRALAVQKFAGEEQRVFALQLRAATLATQSLKPSWISDCSRNSRSTSSGFSSRKGSSSTLFSPEVWTRRSTPNLRDQALEAEARRDDADRPDDRGAVGHDLVGGAGQPVAARRRDVLDEGDHRQLLLAAASSRMRCAISRRLDRRAAGRVDHQRHALAPRCAKARASSGATPFDRQAARAEQAARVD